MILEDLVMADEFSDEFQRLVVKQGYWMYACEKGHGFSTRRNQGERILSRKSKCGHPMSLVGISLKLQDGKPYGIEDIVEAQRKAQEEGRQLLEILDEMDESQEAVSWAGTEPRPYKPL